MATAADCPPKVGVCAGAPRWVVENERIAGQGGIVTGRGMSTSFDLGLHLCRRPAGEDAVRKLKTRMDYSCGA